MKRYSRQEPRIFFWFMLPYTLLLNLLVFGSCIFNSLKVFFLSYGISIAYLAVIYTIYGVVATLIRKRLPEDSQLFRRIAVMLPLFYIMNVLTIQGVYLLYDKINWQGCVARRDMEWWATGFGCMASTLLTFLNEAAVGWEKWKASVSETGQLQSAYQRSRLLSLKRQINPHFLFNCFNTLSSLIHEDDQEAERFLDEMTKVYRYLLKSDDEQLVTLQEELKFIRSYLYLNEIRFGSALVVEISVREGDEQKQLPPFSLQVVLDNIIYQNAFSKNSPLSVSIYTNHKEALVIKNTLHPKSVKDVMAYEEALDNLVNKYKLLYKPKVQIYETATHRMVVLPLIGKEEVVL